MMPQRQRGAETAHSVASLAARRQHPAATREAQGKPEGTVVRCPGTGAAPAPTKLCVSDSLSRR
jgi:hypothetical protein